MFNGSDLGALFWGAFTKFFSFCLSEKIALFIDTWHDEWTPDC